MMGVGTIVAGLLLTAWGATALWYQISSRAWRKGVAVATWLLFALAMLVMTWDRHHLAAAAWAVGFSGLLAWWLTLKPSNDRQWADDVAQMTCGTASGEQVLLHNVRNFDWRTRTDYSARWETRSYDLRELTGVDLILSYWSYTAIAHVLVSFGFAGGDHLAFSVEIRREKSESYSELGGFFRQFELSIIAADERDIVRLRTNVRGEDDYLYRLALPAAARRALFLAYVSEANRLHDVPRFYNTLTSNCTTLVYHMMCSIVGHLPLDYRLILSGYLPGYVYKVGGLDRRYALAQLRAMGRITERARAADRSAGFSTAIRTGIAPPSDLAL